MERMKCAECGTDSYSAAAKTLVEQGDRCRVCGGPLQVQPRERVTVPADVAPEAEPVGRRFQRDD